MRPSVPTQALKGHWETSSSDRTPEAACVSASLAPAEAVEGRTPTKRNAEQAATPRTLSRIRVSSVLLGVREAARRGKEDQAAELRGFLAPSTGRLWIPTVRSIHRRRRLVYAITRGRSRMRESRTYGSVRGFRATGIPTATPHSP